MPRSRLWADRVGGTLLPAVGRRVQELEAGGATDAEIATVLGCATSMAKKARLSLGLHHRVVVEDDQLRALHAEGLTPKRIADSTGLSRRRVEERLKALELPPNKRGRERTAKVDVRWTPDEAAEVHAAAERAGVSASEFVRSATLDRARRSA